MKTTIATILLGICLLETFTNSAETKPAEVTTTKSATTGGPLSGLGEGREGRRMEISDQQLKNALNDKRYLMRQLKCTLGEAPCDPVGRRLKTLAPLVLRGSCPQCTPTEMRQIQMTLLHIQKNFPKEWGRMIRQYQ